MSPIIPQKIAADEPCVRLLFHPMMVSESSHKLKREAMLPRANSNLVSLIRLNYTTMEKCKTLGKQINYGGNDSWGYASVTALDVEHTNQICPEAEAHIVYAPMHRGEYVSTDRDLHVDEENVDLPMHADLAYNKPMPPEACKTRSDLRKYASELVKRMNSTLTKFSHPD